MIVTAITYTQIPNVTVGVNILMLSGYSQVGDYLTGAIFMQVNSGGGPMAIQDRAGVWYQEVAAGGLLVPVLESISDLSAAVSIASTVGAGGNWTSALQQSNGNKIISCGVTSTQAGILSIQRYLDVGGNVLQGTAVTQAINASTPALLNVTDNLPSQSFIVKITNSSGSTATITNFALVLAGL